MKKFLTSKIGNILLCIAEIIVGVLLLVNPDAVTSAFIIGAGAVMILTGIVFCTLYFVGEAEKMVIKQLLFKGLLLIILGVLCVTQYGVLLAALPVQPVPECQASAYQTCRRSLPAAFCRR